MAWIVFLSVVGIILICLELFLPGMVIGILGGLCLISAVVVTYVLYGVHSGNMALLALIIASAAALFLWVTFFPKTRAGRAMITNRDLSDSKTADSLAALLGKTGKALTPLRPAGTAIIEEQRTDVLAESGLIEEDSAVRVVRVEGNRVVVRKI